MNINQMRKQYAKKGISKSEMAPHPMSQFHDWFEESVAGCDQEWMESNAMTLSTCTDSHITSRIVLLKAYNEEGFTFFTSYDSQKGKQLLASQRAALLFYWGHLERQVRVEGKVVPTTREVSQAYFQSRPRESQLSAAVSAQSQNVDSREQLESAVESLDASLKGGPVPTPENWGGFLLKPTRFEFWQGRLNRLHDRIIYQPSDEKWLIKRIQP